MIISSIWKETDREAHSFDINLSAAELHSNVAEVQMSI